jgi:hypothetical protein
MVGLTRFFVLMNLCEKSGVAANVYAGFWCIEKDADFGGVKKLFVLQDTEGFSQRRVRGIIFCKSQLVTCANGNIRDKGPVWY